MEDTLAIPMAARDAAVIVFQYPVVVLALIWVTLKLVRKVWIARTHLRDIPGPWISPYSRLWMLQSLRSGAVHTRYADAHDKYGMLARIGPNNLLTSDPDVFRQMMNVHTKYERANWFDSLRIMPHRANLITERNRSVHDPLRKKLAAGFEGRGVQNFEGTIDSNLRHWMAYIEKHGMSKQGTTVEFDIARSIQWLLFDMISLLCLGRSLGFVNKHTDRFQFQWMLEERLPFVEQFSILTEVNVWTRLIAKIPVLCRMIPHPSDKHGLGAILGIAQNTLKQQQKSGRDPKTMIGSWLSHAVDPTLLPSEITMALFAGSDTTATSIRALLLHVISNPLIYARLTAEIRSACAESRISTPSREVECLKLLYLQACIKEGQRVFPPVVQIRERVVPKGGDTVRGHFVPGGTRIGVNLPGLLHNEVFGQDPKVFRPERWLEASPELRNKMDRCHEFMFNFGSTKCLGVRLANLMEAKFMVEVLRRWDVTTTRPEMPWKSKCHGIFYQKEFFVRITECETVGRKDSVISDGS